MGYDEINNPRKRKIRRRFLSCAVGGLFATERSREASPVSFVSSPPIYSRRTKKTALSKNGFSVWDISIICFETPFIIVKKQNRLSVIILDKRAVFYSVYLRFFCYGLQKSGRFIIRGRFQVRLFLRE